MIAMKGVVLDTSPNGTFKFIPQQVTEKFRGMNRTERAVK